MANGLFTVDYSLFDRFGQPRSDYRPITVRRWSSDVENQNKL